MDGTIWNASGYATVVDPMKIHDFFFAQLKKAGFKVLNSTDYHFSPYGYTSLYLLAESHFAIHTFPEVGITYFELSSCLQAKFDAFIGLLQEHSLTYQVTSVKTVKPPTDLQSLTQ